MIAVFVTRRTAHPHRCTANRQLDPEHALGQLPRFDGDDTAGR